MWFTSTGQFIFGIAVAFTFNYISFVIVRFLLAMVSAQAYPTSSNLILLAAVAISVKPEHLI